MPTLSLQQITAAFDAQTVLRDVSLEVRAGEVVGLIGPNGSGKTTLLRVVGGTLAPESGTVLLDDLPLSQLGAAERARIVAAVPQSLRAPEAFSVAEIVLMGRTPYLPRFGGEQPADYQAAHTAMVRTSTWPFAQRLMGELSGGEQQRVLIARALAQEPQVLLLDEATAHLDLKHQTSTMHLVRRLAQTGLIVIAALHDLNLAALYADRLALLHEGRLLICDTPERVLTREWLRQAYDVPVVIGSHPLYHTPVVSLVIEED